MKLIQANIWGGNIAYTLSDFLCAEKPDILCLQEAVALKPGERGFLFKSVDELAKIMEADHVYMSPTFSYDYMHTTAHFGNCIISKLPFTHQETVFTRGSHEQDFDWQLQRSQENRNFQYVQITLRDNQTLKLFNHHGHQIPAHKNGDDETKRQCQQIAEAIKVESGGKLILTGDFNLVPDSLSLTPLNDLLRNLTKEARLATTRTLLSHKTEPCDYIFVSEDIKVDSFRVSHEVISDHSALILEFS